jgi:hypothetical protein
MLGETTGELRLIIPLWGSIFIGLLGASYLVYGSRWPRFFDVLSMTLIGCMAGLLGCAWVPLPQPIVIIAGGLVLGGLTTLFRNVCHAVLASLVLALILSMLAALAVGAHGFTAYLIFNPSNRSYSMQLPGPSLRCDPVLAAGVTGLLVGATVAMAWFAFSQRLLTAAQGAALVVVALAAFVSQSQGEGGTSLATSYPLTLAAAWLCLVVIGLVAQAAMAQRRSEFEQTFNGAEDPGA